MKSIKHIVLTLCALGFVATASAQGPFFGQFDYSAKAGISIAKMCNTDSRLAFYVGGAAEYYLSEILSLQPELIISGQGGRNKLKAEGASTVTSTRLTYLDIPVLLKVAPIPGSGFSVEAGPMMGFCMGAKMKNKTNLGDSTNTIKESVRDNVNTVEFGVSLGASYVVKKNIGAQIRYNYGFTNVFKNVDNVANQTIEIGAFYLF